MFSNFKPDLFLDPNFKEDSVREIVIAPMLARLGYFPMGNQTLIRSKSLRHPFIYAGTRQHAVTIIPDYTLLFENKPVAILDAKGPNEDLDSQSHIQQAYSYAIHPEIRAHHFALCNGRRLTVHHVQSTAPLLDIKFEEFESKWSEIEKHLTPKYLLNPDLRKLRPDFGFKVSRLGFATGSQMIMIGTRLNTFARVSEDLYTVTVNINFADEEHCVSFDFAPEHLPNLVAGLPEALKQQFLQALGRAPFQACAELIVEVDIETHIGEVVEGESETFVPLVIDRVLGSRFNPTPVDSEPPEIPAHIFRLSKAFTLVRPGQSSEA
jgi:Type I restriction enzyme R protein N terminus (HSDR_N)